MIILGGLGSIWGVVVGAVVLSFINTHLIPDVLNDVPGKIGLDFDLTQLGLRHLRLPARDHDGAATAGPDTREAHQAELAEGSTADEHETVVEARA